MLTVLYARAGQDSRRALLERMGRSEARRCLLLVPEQYSHESERAMCRVLGNGASARCEVLSFTRLAGRLCDSCGGGAAPMLDAGGRMLLMYAALRQVSDSLRMYRTPSRKPAFLTKLLATVDECRSYRVPPEALIGAGEELGGQQGDKWRDIGLIYAAYESLCAGASADPRSRLDRLAQQLKDSRWAENMDICVHGFTDFTPQEEEVLAALVRQAHVTVALACDRERDPGGIFAPARRAAGRLLRRARQEGAETAEETLSGCGRLEPSLAFLEEHLFGALPEPWQGECAVTRVRAADRRQEVEWTAAEILRLLRQDGYRCRDIAVCARRLGAYGELVESTFARYGIPVYESAMTDVLQKPVMALVTSALAAAAEDYPYEELFRYLKTDLTGVSREERDLLENYVLTWDIRGGAWTRERPWDMHPEGYGQTFDEGQRALVERLDALRRRVIAPLEKLRRGGDKTGRGRALALYDLLEDIGLPERLGQRASALEARGDLSGAAEYRQLWDIVAGGLEQCALLLGETELELDEFSRLFSLVLSQYEVGAIPVSLDRVAVGDSPRMAHREVKILFFLGADSTAVPDCEPAPGLFSDQDRDALAAQEVELAPRQEDKLRRELTIAYETCAIPSRRLYVSYAAGGGDGERMPCFLWERLEALFPGTTPVTAGESRLAAPAPALELAGREETLARVLRGVPGFETRVERLEQAARWRRGSLSPAGVRTLYGPVVPMSATRLDLFNSCHFSHFLRFGLDAKPRQKAKFRPTDYGTFVHAVLERVLSQADAHGGVKALAEDRELRRSLARQAADDYEAETLSGLDGETARFRWLFGRMKEAALAVTDSVVEELAASDFVPTRFELKFGKGKELPPVEVTNGVTLRLSGAVDRVDQWKHDGKRYLRVIDYKTGKKSFDFAEVEDGRSLQMLLYLFTLSRTEENVVPAGVLYVPARNPVVDGERTMTDAQVQTAQSRRLRRQGLVLNDPEVIAAMEHTVGDYRFLPIGEGRGRNDYLVSGEQMALLDDYITDALKEAAGQMARGNIAADPYWHDGNRNACRWCDYRAACHFEECCGDSRRWRRSVGSGEFWQWMLRREEDETDGH